MRKGKRKQPVYTNCQSAIRLFQAFPFELSSYITEVAKDVALFLSFSYLIEGLQLLLRDGDLRVDALELDLQVLEVDLVPVADLLGGGSLGVQAVDAILRLVNASLEKRKVQEVSREVGG